MTMMLTVRVCALWITFCWFVGTTVHGEHGISLETDSETVTVRNGSAIQLNCTITGRGNGTQLVADDLFWSHGHTLVTSNTRVLNNRTLQLSIDSTSWDDAGDYLCRLSANHQIPGVNVSVIVGGIPSPPRIVKWENFEVNLKLYWAAPSYDGGLPLKYSLKHEECDDCIYPFKEYSFENGLYSNIYHAVTYENHTVWIEAQNSLGISRSKSVVILLTVDIETVHPCPPIIVSLGGISRAIELHWQRDLGEECTWGIGKEMDFNISYRTKENLHFELKGPTAQENLVLDGLKPYTLYYVYVSTQLVDADFHRSLSSSVVGPLTARTNEEEPSEGPTTISCNTVAWPEEKGKMNVTLKWKPPPRNKWNGIIRSFRVIYRYRENNGTISSYVTIANGSSRQLVLSGLNASSSYHFSVQACTINQDYCTSSLRQCTALSQEPSTPAVSWTSNWNMDFISVFAVVGGVVCLVAIFLTVYFLEKRRKRSNSLSQPDLRVRIDGVYLQQSECPSSQSTSDGEPEYYDIRDCDEKSESNSDCALLTPDQRYICI